MTLSKPLPHTAAIKNNKLKKQISAAQTKLENAKNKKEEDVKNGANKAVLDADDTEIARDQKQLDALGWGGANTVGYLGDFNARGSLRAGKETWANVKVAEEIAGQAVEGLDIKSALELATYFDGDIDGKFGGASSSNVSEGKESFTFGASYSGMQGVSASYVHG